MRCPHIGSDEWINQERGKLGVIRLQFGWYVIDSDGSILTRGDGKFARFEEHSDAITYAHEQATRQALAARFTIPPENPVARAMQEGA